MTEQRFTGTPAQVHAFLLEHFTEGAVLAYQQEIGAVAITEAVDDVQTVRAQADNEGLYNGDWREGWDDFFDRINPEPNCPSPTTLFAPPA
ncbi:hypothetical protein [Actinacidiphila acididurans]|uniref:Uncharacterized protein n=1 Tax=Actinacidiphila acididurans TaxID=2784346 RepID=A0ABS2U360_9ACTN|nr:hypothetical protein [Actinacidiphila acididurans]MBM9510044.1 hypothetical protein [Actinacidiphila acididurans]